MFSPSVERKGQRFCNQQKQDVEEAKCDQHFLSQDMEEAGNVASGQSEGLSSVLLQFI